MSELKELLARKSKKDKKVRIISGNTGTVVSILPIPFNREMTGYIPAYFSAPPSKGGQLVLMHVPEVVDYIYQLDHKHIPRTIGGFEVAEEMVRTYVAAQLYVDANCRPGVMAIPGTWKNPKEVAENYSKELDQLREWQTNWFERMAKQADDDWQKWQQHRMISTLQIVAANELGLVRDWAKRPDFKVKFIHCPACDTIIKSTVAVCPTCKVIVNAKKAEKFKFAS